MQNACGKKFNKRARLYLIFKVLHNRIHCTLFHTGNFKKLSGCDKLKLFGMIEKKIFLVVATHISISQDTDEKNQKKILVMHPVFLPSENI